MNGLEATLCCGKEILKFCEEISRWVKNESSSWDSTLHPKNTDTLWSLVK